MQSLKPLLHPAILLSAVAACSGPRTEVVVVVKAGDGVVVPRDFDRVTMTVVDLDAPQRAQQFSTAVCPGATPCTPLPVTATLYPGPGDRQHLIQLTVEAVRGMTTVVTDGAAFQFVQGESELLEFEIYSACLGKPACAASQSCDVNGNCVETPQPTLFTGELDLASPVDQAVTDSSFDFPPGADLAGADLTTCRGSCASTDMAQPPPDMAKVDSFVSGDGGGCGWYMQACCTMAPQCTCPTCVCHAGANVCYP